MNRSFPGWASSLSRDEYAHRRSQSTLLTLVGCGMWVCRDSAKGLARLKPSRCTVAAKETQRRKNVQWDKTAVAYAGWQNTVGWGEEQSFIGSANKPVCLGFA